MAPHVPFDGDCLLDSRSSMGPFSTIFFTSEYRDIILMGLEEGSRREYTVHPSHILFHLNTFAFHHYLLYLCLLLSTLLTYCCHLHSL